MNTYRMLDDILVSREPGPWGEPVSDAEAAASAGRYLFVNNSLSQDERTAYRVNHCSQLEIAQEDVSLLWQKEESCQWPLWFREEVAAGQVIAVNTAHTDWQTRLSPQKKKNWRVNVAGLGDVGGMLLAGLRLLGQGTVGTLGLYDPDPAKCERWEREIGQICTPFETDAMTIEVVKPETLFDCDMFVFCASRSVPPLDQSLTDVRMVQLAGNSEILKPYAQQAVREAFSGLFAVVSDPVDQLCGFVQQVMKETAAQESLAPPKAEQIRGYGLGVMNGRAAWYAKRYPEFAHFLQEGRAYGPHGKGLVIADSIENYDAEKSLKLTELTLNANFEVRSAGFKPYVAPALSSGAIALIRTLQGEWHYSAVSLGGVFIGCKNRLVQGIQETECLVLPEALKERLRSTASLLRENL